MKRVLAVRQDNNGDVLLTGPALRAIRHGCDHVTLLCGPRGRAAARVLAGPDATMVFEAAWIDAEPQPLLREDVEVFIAEIARQRYDEAIVFTSFHQSPLPMALLLRMAGIRRIGAISVDYPGSLLDVRLAVEDDIHEVERACSLARAMGYGPPQGDDGRIVLRRLPERCIEGIKGYVVVHPGATVPARAWAPQGNRAVVELLANEGYDVVVTGSSAERALCAEVAQVHPRVRNLCDTTTFEQFAAVIRDAAAVICGNTAAVHVASAVGTPVVEIFAPTIPFARFRPWKVPFVMLGNQDVPCAGCRARRCPVSDQPCISSVKPHDVLEALRRLVPAFEAA